MTVKIPTTILKLSSVALLSATLVFAIKYYDARKQNVRLKENMRLDKETYTNELKEILNRYDAEVLRNQQLLDEKGIIEKEEVVASGNDVYHLEKKIIPIGKQVEKTKKDTFESLFHKKMEENEDLSYQLNQMAEKNKELQKKNNDNEAVIAVSKNLTATNVVANGIKIVSNNIIETKRFNATEQIKVCFTLLENKAAVKGYKDVYIQIVNPDGKVVSKNGEFVESGDRLLSFSAKTNVYYDNEELDVCVFVDPNKKDMSKGDYEINIFSGINLIGSTVFSLK
ncbi:hypothetical protein NAT51_10820 [Flavobacterium amniphilum]|uniref:hypothetical protein n=1 Tax=Flavobacterium amniphilum TaxID=1834035 RepID=UPI00202A80F5|nr:hypothetical protein [Flavobacterium amniphilum]MCL9806019.1 hypothetical protein [Flavobacterium amniphilum]